MPDNTHLPPPLTHRPPLPQHPAHTAISPPHGAPCHPTAGASRHPSQIYPGNGTNSSTCNRPPATIAADVVYRLSDSSPSPNSSSTTPAGRRPISTLHRYRLWASTTCPPSAPSRFHSSSNAAIRRAYATLSSPTPASRGGRGQGRICATDGGVTGRVEPGGGRGGTGGG